MEIAIDQARRSQAESGIPIGAALFDGGGGLVAAGYNERIQRGDPIAHGEMSCIRNGGRRRSYRDLTLYTTLAPCAMCAGAVLLFKIPLVVVGEAQNFPGELELLISRGVEVLVLENPVCVEMMAKFISENTDMWNEDIASLSTDGGQVEADNARPQIGLHGPAVPSEFENLQRDVRAAR